MHLQARRRPPESACDCLSRQSAVPYLSQPGAVAALISAAAEATTSA